MCKVNKGDIVWANLPMGGDCVQHGMRPVLILGNPAACEHSPVVTVLPISSKTEKAKKIPTHVRLINALKKDSIILPEQIRSISKKALTGNPIYTLSEKEMAMVDDAIKRQLGIY